MPVTNRSAGAQAGDVKFFAGSAAQAGWLKANGALVSRTAYAALFAAIGTTYGAGDGATTFALPDYRGEFIRGADDGRGVDVGRAIGSAQLDAFQGHSFNVNLGADTLSGSAVQNYRPGGAANAIGAPISNGTHGAPRVAAETRPRNVAALACIKY